MDNRHSAKRRRASAFLEAIERRDNGRSGGSGELSVFWHHDPSCTCRYETLDVSGSGARVRTEGSLPEGMTGVAVRYEPGAIEINRAIMVVWSRGIRDPDGRVGHHEAGIRYL